MRRGEVWWVEFDPAVGSEIQKTRPAVIVSNDAANRHLARVVVVPVTSNTGRQYPGEAIVTIADERRKVMADQIMAADKSRLKQAIATLSKVDMLAVEDAIKVHLALPTPCRCLAVARTPPAAGAPRSPTWPRPGSARSSPGCSSRPIRTPSTPSATVRARCA